jgi:hypothetical protein
MDWKRLSLPPSFQQVRHVLHVLKDHDTIAVGRAAFCNRNHLFLKGKRLEAISKPQIAFDGKARADEKAQHTWEYVSILKRFST